MQPVEQSQECSHCGHSSDGKSLDWLFLAHLLFLFLLLGFTVALKLRRVLLTELTRELWISPIHN